jgi:hypothetical protein
VCREFRRDFGGTILRGWADISHSLNAIANAAFVLSTRLHCAICAAALGTPYRVLPYGSKHHEFAGSIKARATLVEAGRKPRVVVEDLLNAERGLLPGVRHWLERFDEFRDSITGTV